jgi:hypothetical protein
MAITTLNNRAINRSDTASADQVWTATSATASDFQAAAGGKTLGVSQYLNSTRASISNSTSAITVLSSSYTQIKANSKLLIGVFIQGYSTGTGFGNWNFIYDGSSLLNPILTDHNASFLVPHTGYFLIDGASSTGSKNWSITFSTDNSSSNRPFAVLNPNSTDSAIASQHASRVVITELDL